MNWRGRVWLLLVVGAAPVAASDWRQFRGPNGSGISDDTGLPLEFGPDRNVVWKAAVPAGLSSPVVAGGKVFITAVENERIFTLAFDARTGRPAWRREAPRPRVQEMQRKPNGPASASPVSDGRNVYVFFTDFGLLAYAPDGRELWRVPLGPFNNPFGHGASPVLAGGTLLMACDQDTNSFLLAVDKRSGRVLWRAERPLAQRGYSTPVLWRPPGGALQALLAGSYRLVAYDVATGKEVWWVRGLPWQIKPTPVLDGGVVYFATYSGDSESGHQEVVAAFKDALAQLDKDGDRRISRDEVVDPRMKSIFDDYLDLDDSGYLEERDWNQFRERRLGEATFRACRLGGTGDVTDRNCLWKNPRLLPNVPSPLVYRGVVYTLKEGGIFASYDPPTGTILKQGRLEGALGTYFASPVAADGRIYTFSDEGKGAVLEAAAQWRVLAVNDLGDGCKATPAIADGRLYVRTDTMLYCFAKLRE